MNYYHIELTPRVSTFVYRIEAENKEDAIKRAEELADFDYDQVSLPDAEDFYKISIRKINT